MASDQKAQQQEAQQAAGSRLAAWIAQNHENQPSLAAEAKAWFREGREDFLNAFLKAFPDSMSLGREQGAPGSPTAQIVTADLTGRQIDYEMDR